MKNLKKFLLFVLVGSSINFIGVSPVKAAPCAVCEVSISGCTCGTANVAATANRFCCNTADGGRGQFFSSAEACRTGCAASTGTGGDSTNNATQAGVEIENPIETEDFTELVTNFLGWLLGIAGALAFLMFVWGGILYVTSAGDEQKAAKGKRIVTWTILGLIVILMSYSIIALIEDIFVNE